MSGPVFHRPKGLAPDAHVFISVYECSCGNVWEDRWDSGCDDECAACGLAIQPADIRPDPDCDCAACKGGAT